MTLRANIFLGLAGLLLGLSAAACDQATADPTGTNTLALGATAEDDELPPACDDPMGPGAPDDGAPAGTLTEAQTASLLHLREEEKVARDVYLTFSARWGTPIFANIARSEQRHMDAVGRLLTRYGLTDPVVDDTVGAFTEPALATLYAKLTASGEEAVGEALRVGALIEDMDLFDLGEALAEAPPADVARVYANLSRGSRNHLRAFVGRLDDAELLYEPTYLTAEAVDAIVSSPRERSPGAGGGRGMGRGGMGRGGMEPGGGAGPGACLGGPTGRSPGAGQGGPDDPGGQGPGTCLAGQNGQTPGACGGRGGRGFGRGAAPDTGL